MLFLVTIFSVCKGPSLANIWSLPAQQAYTVQCDFRSLFEEKNILLIHCSVNFRTLKLCFNVVLLTLKQHQWTFLDLINLQPYSNVKETLVHQL